MSAVVAFGGTSVIGLNQKGARVAFRKGLKGQAKEGHMIQQKLSCYCLEVYKKL